MKVELDDLRAPEGRPGFHAELRRRVESAERRARNRRRVAAVVAAGAAIVIASAAGVSAFRDQTKPLDQSVSCSVPDQGGVNVLDLQVRAKAPPFVVKGHTIPNPAQAVIEAGPFGAQTQFVGVTAAHGGYLVNQDVCHAGAAAVPLTRAGLTTVNVVRGRSGAEADKECWLAPTATIRMHIAFSGSGAPVAAQIALWSGAKRHAAAFIDWSPTRATVYTASRCNHG